MVSAEEALKIILERISVDLREDSLTLNNFREIDKLSLSLGKEVTVAGYITNVSPRNSYDKDVHFDLSTTQDGDNNIIVCEIQNGSDKKHGVPLQQAKDDNKMIKVKGVLRFFLEHAESTSPTLQHVFEIHPVREIYIDDQPMGNIEVDCPGGDKFKKLSSVHKMTINDDGSMSTSHALNDTKDVTWDGRNVTIDNPNKNDTNYVYASAYFYKTQEGDFPTDEPYIFELRKSQDSVGVKAAAIPSTQAYDSLAEFHSNPPTDKVTIVGIRSLNIPELKNKYEVALCPVYRVV